MRIYDLAFTISYLILEGFCPFSGILLQIKQQLFDVTEIAIINNRTSYFILSNLFLFV